MPSRYVGLKALFVAVCFQRMALRYYHVRFVGGALTFGLKVGGFETRLIMHFSHVNMIKMVKKNIDMKTVFIFISGGDVLGTCHM